MKFKDKHVPQWLHGRLQDRGCWHLGRLPFLMSGGLPPRAHLPLDCYPQHAHASAATIDTDLLIISVQILLGCIMTEWQFETPPVGRYRATLQDSASCHMMLHHMSYLFPGTCPSKKLPRQKLIVILYVERMGYYVFRGGRKRLNFSQW